MKDNRKGEYKKKKRQDRFILNQKIIYNDFAFYFQGHTSDDAFWVIMVGGILEYFGMLIICLFTSFGLERKPFLPKQ